MPATELVVTKTPALSSFTQYLLCKVTEKSKHYCRDPVAPSQSLTS